MTPVDPPAWCERIVSRVVPVEDHDEVLGDLNEAFAQRVNTRSYVQACAWYAAQVVLLMTGLRNRRVRKRTFSRMSGIPWPESWWSGLRSVFRNGARTVYRSPFFSVVTMGTIALGVGAITATYAVVDAVLLSPLPYPNAERLVSVSTRFTSVDEARTRLSGPAIDLLQRGSQQLDAVGAVWPRFASLTDGDTPEQVNVGIINGQFFQAIGAVPQLGRFINMDDDRPGVAPVLVISHEIWQRRYGGDSTVVGGTVDYNGEAHTVIGVLPRGFQLRLAADAALPARMDVFVPWGGDWAEMDPDWHLFNGFARLAPAATAEAFNVELAAISNDLRARNAAYERNGLALQSASLREDVTATLRPSIVAIFAAAALVGLIAWANAAALLAMRLERRAPELNVRAALGATRTRLVSALTGETVLLFAVGSVAGFWLAGAALDVFVALAPPELRRVGDINPSLWMAGTIGAVVLATAVVVTVFPFMRRAALQRGALISGTRVVRAGNRNRMLVVAETAVAVVLLIGATLLVRTYQKLANVDVGFDPAGVETARLSLPSTRYSYEDPEPIARLYRQLDLALSEQPGVASVGMTDLLPLGATSSNPTPYAVRAGTETSEWGSLSADYRVVTPGFFSAAGFRLVAGRGFTPDETIDTPIAVVIDSELAGRHWPDGDAVGQEIQVSIFRHGVSTPTWGSVVGVVQHVRHTSLVARGRPQVYLAHGQTPRRSMTIAARTAGGFDLAATTRAELRFLDPLLPVFGVRPFRDYVSDATATTTLVLWLLAAFAGVAVTLSLVGLFATTALHVRSQTAEIGVRIALGSNPGDVCWLYARRSWVMGLIGIVVGLGGAMLAASAMRSLIFGISALDPLTFAIVGLICVGLTLLAAWVPAREASAVDPVQAIRASQ